MSVARQHPFTHGARRALRMWRLGVGLLQLAWNDGRTAAPRKRRPSRASTAFTLILGFATFSMDGILTAREQTTRRGRSGYRGAVD